MRFDPIAPLRDWLARPPRRPARPRFRPALQQLEGRALPSTASPPTVDPVLDQTVAEDTNGGPDHTFTVTGISPGAGFHSFNVQINWDRADIIPQGDFTFGNFSGVDPQSVPLTFSTAPNANGTVHVTLTVTDMGTPDNGESPGTTVIHFNVNVTPVNDPPTANPFSAVGGGAGILHLTGNDGDPEVQQALTFTITSNPAHGTLSNLNPATGDVTYTPNPGYSGPDSFAFTVTDDGSAGPPAGLTSSPATVSLTVIPFSPPPGPGSSSAFLKSFQLLLNRKRPQLSKLRLDFAGDPGARPGVFPVQVGPLSLKVKVVVTPSGGDTLVDLSLVLPKKKLVLTTKLLRQLQGVAPTLAAQILAGGL
jgi:hypothetical protein